jgi:hypothetical protein
MKAQSSQLFPYIATQGDSLKNFPEGYKKEFRGKGPNAVGGNGITLLRVYLFSG